VIQDRHEKTNEETENKAWPNWKLFFQILTKTNTTASQLDNKIGKTKSLKQKA
jgi:hypothetical protein